MTSYLALRHSSGHAWKRRQVQAKWKNLLALLIVLILILASFNGLVKTFSIGKYLGTSNWNSNSSFVAVLSTTPLAVFILQEDPKRLVFLTLDEKTYLITGNPNEPIAKISFLINKSNGRDLSKLLSLTFRANIENYVTFKNDQKINKEEAIERFKNYSSLLAPFMILTGIIGDDVKDTNIARLDQFKLWWQIKSVRINQLELVDLSQYQEEVVYKDDQKVLGVDNFVLHKVISKYLGNENVIKENLKIKVINASGIAGVGQLAADFAAGVGVNIVKIETAPNFVDKSFIQTSLKNKYTVRYLANIFKCDIKNSSESGEEVSLVIGSDFASRYFK